MKYCIEIFKDWNLHTNYWRIKSKNGEVLAHSENYSSYRKARQTARALSKETKMQIILREEVEK